MVAVLTVLLLVQAQPGEWSEAKPAALLAVEQARAEIRKARMDWSVTNFFDPWAHGQPLYRRSVISGGQAALFLDGTSEGVVSWKEDGTPIEDSRWSQLKTENEHWEYENHVNHGSLWREHLNRPLSDPRTIGLLPSPTFMTTVPQALWSYGRNENTAKPRLFRERIVAGLHEVEMQGPEADTTVKWYIDPMKGWNPVRTQHLYRGKPIGESISEYALRDGFWFPSAVAYLDSVGNMVSLVEVSSAQINTPDIPDILTPDILGLKPGMRVSVNDGPDMHKDCRYAGAGQVLTDDVFWAEVKAGRIKLDNNSKAAQPPKPAGVGPSAPSTQAAQKPASAPATTQPVIPNKVDDEWERYTREFIARYKLDDDQTQVAWRILRSCQEQRTAYLRSRIDRIRMIESKLQGKIEATEGDKLLGELDELQKPIQKMFEEGLKPRLDRLPTKAQRKAADETKKAGAPTTQPSQGG